MNGDPVDPVLALSGWVALGATLLPAAEPLRVLLVVLFLVFCPGAAAVRWAAPAPDRRNRLSALLETGILAVALSLAIGALVAEAFFLSHRFTSARALATLAVITTLLVLAGYHRRRRRAAADPPAEPPGTGRTRPEAMPRAGRTALTVALAIALAMTASGCGGRGGGTPDLSPTGRSATDSMAPAASASTTRSPVPAPTPTPVPAAPGPWHPVFADDFTGTELNASRWTRCYDWNLNGCTNAGNHETEWYLPGQVTVGDGLLNLTAQRRGTVGSDGVDYPWRSGMVSTGRDSWDATPRHVFTYGYFAARIKVPAGAGFFPAFWLMPASRHTPPELDVVEFIGGSRTAILTVHWTGPGGKDLHEGKHVRGPADFSAGYHVYALDWEKGSLTWYIDGVPQLSLHEHVPAVPMEMLLTLAVGFPTAPAASADSAVMRTDWVRVWQH